MAYQDIIHMDLTDYCREVPKFDNFRVKFVTFLSEKGRYGCML